MSIKKNLINIEKFIKKEHKNEISEYQKNYREEHKDNDEWKVDALTNDQIKKIQGMF